MPRSVAFDLGLHCLFMSHKKDARLIWVKDIFYIFTMYPKCIDGKERAGCFA